MDVKEGKSINQLNLLNNTCSSEYSCVSESRRLKFDSP